jgi:hypothetical protein
LTFALALLNEPVDEPDNVDHTWVVKWKTVYWTSTQIVCDHKLTTQHAKEKFPGLFQYTLRSPIHARNFVRYLIIENNLDVAGLLTAN